MTNIVLNYLTLVGLICCLLAGGAAALLACGYFAQRVYREYVALHSLHVLGQAIAEWRINHPEEAAKIDRRIEKAEGYDA